MVSSNGVGFRHFPPAQSWTKGCIGEEKKLRRAGVYNVLPYNISRDSREAYRSSILSLLWYHIALSALIFEALVHQGVVFELLKN